MTRTRCTDHDKPHFDAFFTTVLKSLKKMFFQSAMELKKALCDTLTRAAWTFIHNGKLANHISRLAAILVCKNLS